MGARWLYMLPALLLSVLAVILAFIGLAREPESSEASPAGVVMQVTEEQIEEALKHSYWVASRELNIGTTISEDDFRKVGVSVPLAEAVSSDESVKGKLLRRNVREGEILSKSHLQASNRLARAVPAGFRAFSIGIDDVVATGGLLQPGDLVDVLAHFKNGDGEDNQPTAMVLLNSIEVMAVHGKLETAPTDSEAEQQQRRGRNATAVLAVPREEMPKLFLADSNGDLRLALAGESQHRKVPQEGQDELDLAQVETDDVEGAKGKSTSEDPTIMTKISDLFPEKKKAQPVRRAPAPRGQRVEVYEGSTSRSTYVH
ncbi:Flp pilus assembly protein CpaB [Alloalcanivorax xenomutans]|uniref:Flp pilus assembly protein CpaB n=1 Tax=Alloalcanivorax xenomutans TaxID=1094342 RepID=UPI003BAD4DD7